MVLSPPYDGYHVMTLSGVTARGALADLAATCRLCHEGPPIYAH